MTTSSFTFYSTYMYSGLCTLRPPIQPKKYGLKLKVFLKLRDNYNETLRFVSPIDGLKMEGIVKKRGSLYIADTYHQRDENIGILRTCN